MSDSKDVGVKGNPAHVYLVNPPIQEPWATKGEYRQQQRRQTVLFWAHLATLAVAVLGVIAIADSAVDNMAEAANAIDWDAKWSRAVRDQLTDAGLRVVQTPYRAPNANAHAERFVRSIKEECLHRIVPLGERHFRHTVSEFVTHYHRERPHQGCGNTLLEPRQSRQPRGGAKSRAKKGRPETSREGYSS